MDENHHFIRSLRSNMTKYKFLFDSKKKNKKNFIFESPEVHSVM